jgi:hypothetical protein
LPFLSNFALEYTSWKVQENDCRMEYGTHQLLVYADVNSFGQNITTTKKKKHY